MQITLTHQDLNNQEARKTRQSAMGDGWIVSGGGSYYRYDDSRDVWELVTPKQTQKLDADNDWITIPKKERIYEPAGLEFHTDEIHWNPDVLYNIPRNVLPFLWARKTSGRTLVRGTVLEIRTGHQASYYWNTEPTYTIAGNGILTIRHPRTAHQAKEVEFEKPAEQRKLIRDKWLELKRQRARTEKSLKVLKRLGSITPAKLPTKTFDQFTQTLDDEQDARCYERLLQSLEPDCPGVSSLDMKRFGELVLYDAQRVGGWYYHQGNANPSTVSATMIDKAFDRVRARLRTKLYELDDIYEWTENTDLPSKIKP